MSRDVHVQDVPPDVDSVDEIDDDWRPGPLGVGYAEVVEAVRTHAPTVIDDDPSWIHVEGDGIDIELSIDPVASPLRHFSFHDRSPQPRHGDRFIAAVLDHLDLRAFDPTGSDSGIFEFTEDG